jgi:DNA-binding CsgD family transcriptional regulator
MYAVYEAVEPPAKVFASDLGRIEAVRFGDGEFSVHAPGAGPGRRIAAFVLGSIGLYSAEIAALINIPESTVGTNIVSLRRFLGARSMPHAVARAFEQGFYRQETPIRPSSLRLHPREQTVLECAKQGLTMQQTADVLGLSPLTVKSHRQHMLRRHGLNGRGLETVVLLSELLPHSG